jgi:mgtE-like transporter
MNKIIKESWKVLIFASILSSIGGFSLEFIKEKIFVFLPLLIIIPALNDMIGDAGITLVSKVTTYLNLGKISTKKINNKSTRHLFYLLLIIFTVSSVYVTFLSVFIGYLKGFTYPVIYILKMLGITFITTLLIILLVFFIWLFVAVYAYNRKIDPDDLLIPITTSIADLGSLIVFSLLVYLMF